MSLLKGGINLLMNLFYGDKNIVSQNEADRRAEVCLNCPHNTFPDKANFVKWADEMALLTIRNNKSKYHESLGNCDVCSCNMRAKVFFGSRIVLSDEEKEKMQKVGCWQLEFTEKGYNDGRYPKPGG